MIVTVTTEACKVLGMPADASAANDSTQACALAVSILDNVSDPLEEVDICMSALNVLRGISLRTKHCKGG